MLGNYVTICSRAVNTSPAEAKYELDDRGKFYEELASQWAREAEYNYKLKTSYPEILKHYKSAVDDINTIIEMDKKKNYPYTLEEYARRVEIYAEMAQVYTDKNDKTHVLKLATEDFLYAHKATDMYESKAKRYGKQLKCLESGHTDCSEW